MKLTRYDIRAHDDWGGRILWDPNGSAEWCSSAQVEK
jgi:hypothetical protein